MNILIVHSNANKSTNLEELIFQCDRRINILGNLTTVEETMDFLSHNESEIDLIFLETYLADGFNADTLRDNLDSKSIIYTSSLKEDAYKAIKQNCVDFVLEPFDYHQVTQAILKTKSIGNSHYSKRRDFKKRFIIKFGDKIQYKNVNDISYIFAEGKMAFIVTRSTNRKYIIEYTLDELEKKYLNPSNFYRINRKFVVNIDVIEEARNYVNSRLKLILNPATDFDLVVSREKVNDFKNWLNL